MADATEEKVTMATADEDDERTMELSALQAIFPELTIDEKQQFTATLELPVAPLEPVPIVFTDATDKPPMEADRLQVHQLRYLPNIRIRITLPEGYPAEKPPVLELSATPRWLPPLKIAELLKQCEELWEDMGHDQVLYTSIDHIQDSAQGAFGLLDGDEYLRISSDLEIELLDHDKSATQAEFERQSYDCGICLEPKRGNVCYKLDDCGHIFCRKCLQDFYNNAITEGDLDSVKCLDPGCAKRREDELAKSGRKRKPKVTLAPSELLLIPLEHEMVKRYVTMRHKIELENDKSTVYCPRSFCQGAARSKKHMKPIITSTFVTAAADEEADEESDDELVAIDPSKPPNLANLLRVCEDWCYQRLWELEGGDGNDVGYNYAGGNHPPGEGDQLNAVEDVLPAPQRLVVEPEQELVVDDEHEGDRAIPPVAQDEGPLVLRLAPVAPRPAPAAAPVRGPGQGQPNPRPAAGGLGGRFARAAARRAAAEAEADERRLQARNAAWNR
ncbi:hypothetical protein V492_07244, partial [Pseudogymnoascus sp. VKM F-4246]